MIENRLLLRQIRKHLGPDVAMTPQLEALLLAVQDAYAQSDSDRKLLERSMELSSGELFKVNEALRKEHTRTIEVIRRLRQLAASLDEHACAANALDGSCDDVLALSSWIEKLVAKRAEAEAGMRVALEEAKAASRAKSEFLATMSHEIRTPMNGVIGFTDLLLESHLDPKQRSYVDTMRRSGEALLALINDILDFSKIEAGKFECVAQPVVAGDVLADSIALLEPRAAEKDLRLVLRVRADRAPLVLADPSRLHQVALNLAGNAVKFTERGYVHVDIFRGVPADQPWSTSLAERGIPQDHIVIAVSDSGPGIPAEVQVRLFEKFTQADSSTTRRFGGTGLGLAISKKIVEIMGGKIGVYSRPGQGATFWFSLPPAAAAASGAAPAAAKAPSPASPDPGDRGDDAHAHLGLHVLVAEDNEINQMITSEVLRCIGCTSEFVDNGQSAIERLQHGRYDVVLMDCRMPVMDGYTAAREFRRIEPPGRRIPIIALTADAIAGDRERCLRSGMDDYVTKPITIEDVERALRRCAGAPRPAAVI